MLFLKNGAESVVPLGLSPASSDYESFEHFVVNSFENKDYYFPLVWAGKFYGCGGKMLMPLSVTCRHSDANGWQLAKFFEKLQAETNEFEKYI